MKKYLLAAIELSAIVGGTVYGIKLAENIALLFLWFFYFVNPIGYVIGIASVVTNSVPPEENEKLIKLTEPTKADTMLRCLEVGSIIFMAAYNWKFTSVAGLIVLWVNYLLKGSLHQVAVENKQNGVLK